MRKAVITILATAGFVASPVSAQDISNVSEQEMAATVRYALPLLLTAVRAKCATTLGNDGYFAEQGDSLIARYRDGAGEQWPVAKRVLLKLAAEEDSESRALLAGLSDESLRPFVDGLLPSLVATDIKPETCPTIERAMELIAPLHADYVAALGAFVFAEISKEGEEATQKPSRPSRGQR